MDSNDASITRLSALGASTFARFLPPPLSAVGSLNPATSFSAPPLLSPDLIDRHEGHKQEPSGAEQGDKPPTYAPSHAIARFLLGPSQVTVISKSLSLQDDDAAWKAEFALHGGTTTLKPFALLQLKGVHIRYERIERGYISAKMSATVTDPLSVTKLALGGFCSTLNLYSSVDALLHGMVVANGKRYTMLQFDRLGSGGERRLASFLGRQKMHGASSDYYTCRLVQANCPNRWGFVVGGKLVLTHAEMEPYKPQEWEHLGVDLPAEVDKSGCVVS